MLDRHDSMGSWSLAGVDGSCVDAPDSHSIPFAGADNVVIAHKAHAGDCVGMGQEALAQAWQDLWMMF